MFVSNRNRHCKKAPVYNRLHLPESKLLRAGFWVEFSASNCSASLNISVCCSGEAVFPRFVDATAFLRLLCGHIWDVNIVFWDQIVQGTGVTNATLHASHYKTLKPLLWHKSRPTGEDASNVCHPTISSLLQCKFTRWLLKLPCQEEQSKYKCIMSGNAHATRIWAAVRSVRL